MLSEFKLSTLTSALKAAGDFGADYKAALSKLLAYSAQVKALYLPDLRHSENWPGGTPAYMKTQEEWESTASNLRSWALTAMGQLTTLPPYFIDSGKTIICPMLGTALDDVDGLIKNPTSKPLKDDLLSTLKFLQTKFSTYNGMSQALVQTLENQRAKFMQDAQTMRNIAISARQTKGVDLKKIDELNRAIKTLQDDITSRAWAIVGGSLATVIGVGMGVTAIALAWATAGISLFLLIPAFFITAGGVYIIALNAIQIEEDKAEIEKKSKTLSQTEADILLLDSMAKTLDGFADQVAEMQGALSVIIAPWQVAEDYFASSIAVIEQIETASKDDWNSVKTQLTSIRDGWNNEMLVMDDIRLDTQVSNAKLEVGMSEAQVKNALDTGENKDIVAYLAA
jgi:hypothetical protein